MEQKVFEAGNKGMLRDLSISKMSNKYAYDNRNIRITPLDHDTLLSVTNEKGTLKVLDNTISGTAIGWCVLNQYLIVFTADTSDRIYKIELKEDGTWDNTLIYTGHLNFSTANPIESLGLYESSELQKVYWVDGVNQPRVINISKTYTYSGDTVDTQFDFVTTFSSGINVDVEKGYNGSGMFPSGVIQYFITYYNKYGQETNIVYQSPQYYLSDINRGASPEESTNCSFTLNVTGFDRSFDFIRVYSLIRTSYNTTPTLNIVGDISIPEESEVGQISITDVGTYSETIDPTVLLFIGGVEISAYTLTQKDNTLFLGNIENKSEIVDKELSDLIDNFRERSDRDSYMKFVKTDSDTGEYTIPYYPNAGYYPYVSQLGDSSYRIKTFKGGEYYRIGIRFFTKTGAGTSIYWLGDVFNPIYPELDGIVYNRAILSFSLTQEIYDYVSGKYNQYQLYMAEASQSDRTVLAQGVVSPTVFNIRQRCNNSPFSLASWYFRFDGNTVRGKGHYSQIPTMATNVEFPDLENADISFTNTGVGTEIQGIIEEAPITITEDESSDIVIKTFKIWISAELWWVSPVERGGYFWVQGYGYDADGNVVSNIAFTSAQPGDYIAYTDRDTMIRRTYSKLEALGIPRSSLPNEATLNALMEFAADKCSWGKNWNKRVIAYQSRSGGYVEYYGSDFDNANIMSYQGSTVLSTAVVKAQYIAKYGNNFFIDNSILTFHSPEITNDSSDSFENCHLRIIGYAPVTSNISNIDIQASSPQNGTKTIYPASFNSSAENAQNLSGLNAYPLWQDITVNGIQSLYWIYPWHKTGSISRIEIMDNSDPDNPRGTGEYYSILEHKTLSNLFYCYDTVFKVPDSVGDVPDIGWKNQGEHNDTPADNIRLIKGDTNNNYVFSQNSDTLVYNGDCDTILSFVSNIDDPDYDQKYPIINTGGENASSSQEMLTLTSTAQKSSYDSVNIAFKSTAHLLVSFNDIIYNGDSYKSTLPILGDVVNTTVLSGDLPWEELSDGDYPYYDFMAYQRDYPQFSVNSLGGNKYEILNDSYEDWDNLITPYITGNKDVYFAYVDGGGTHLMKITGLDIVTPSLSTPQFTASINEEGTVTINITSPIGEGITYSGEIKQSSQDWGQGTELSFTSTSYTVSDCDVSHIYDIRIKAVADGYTDSEYATQSVYINGISLSPTSLSLEYTDTSEHEIQLYCPVGWSASIEIVSTGENSIGTLSNSVEPRVGKIIEVTAVPADITEACYLNDIRYGRRWFYDPETNTVTAPEYGSSQYISTPVGWEIDPSYKDSPYLFIAEVYRDYNPDTFYGGNTEFAIRNNTFIPISARYPITTLENYGVEGDTFFQRWDCLKTEPYSEGKENNIIELLSFMVETHQNIDGRYDLRRGLMDNLTTSSSNINLVNPVYSQPDNFITGNILDSSEAITKFPSEITWTKTKTMTEDIDTWTNITLASVLDLDGDKGDVTALRRFGNSIVAFQERGIAEILFNTRTQMSTEDGVPIELANSGKVDGKRYISDKIGCINKWSIVEASSGVYFIDNVNSSISVFNGSSITSLSNNKGFKAWMQNNNSVNIWNPVDFDNFIGFYDRANDDVYFVGKDEALCYNELLTDFSSFYSYEQVPIMATVQNKFIAIKNNSLYEMHEGEYNNFFGVTKPFSMTYRITPDPYKDKTFTNLLYKADVFSSSNEFLPDETFNTLDVWTEYQRGSVELDYKTPQLSNLKRKFRGWAAFIPRDAKGADNPFGLNRIRNPWIYLKLEKNSNLVDNRMEIHNILVSYIE